MSANTKIEWADHTFNPFEGCAKVSAGCANCYAETRAERFGTVKRGKGQPRRRTSAANWKQPVKWSHAPWLCDECGAGHAIPGSICMTSGCDCETKHRARVFCASIADWLDDEVPIEWLADLLKLIHDTPNLSWLLLTKRPDNFSRRNEAAQDWHFDHGDRNLAGWLSDWRRHGIAPPNVWLGVSCENQAMADKRMAEAEKIPARIRFISYEPALERVDFRFTERKGLWHWLIPGGESGPDARPCNVEWIRDGVRQCREAGVKCFVKQLGANVLEKPPGKDPAWMAGVEWKKCLRDKKGGDPSEWSEDLRVREWPTPATL